MAKPDAFHQLQLSLQVLEEQVGQALQEVRMERVEVGAPQSQGTRWQVEQKCSLESKLFHLNKEIRKRDLELNRERKRRRSLEAKLSERDAELNREKQQLVSLEEELQQKMELTRVDESSQNQNFGSLLKTTRGSDGESLIADAKVGNTGAVKFLIDRGVDIQTKDSGNCTPLHHAAKMGHLGTVQLLVNYGAQVNAKSVGGVSPLHEAAMGGHHEVCKVLLTAGAQVNQRNAKRMNALHLAARWGHMRVVELLLQHKGDVTLKDRRGRTASDLANRGRHRGIVSFLSAVELGDSVQ